MKRILSRLVQAEQAGLGLALFLLCAVLATLSPVFLTTGNITNILRDVVEDAGENRIYLPREWLDQAGVDIERGAAAMLEQDGLAEVCARLAARARERFAEADHHLARCDRRALRAALIMRDVYALLLERLESRGWRRLDEPVRVGGWEKVWILLRRLMA